MRRMLGVGVAAAGALVLATQSPAAAATRWLEHGWDTAQADFGSDVVKVKDYECDGNGVYVMFNTLSEANGWEYHKVRDRNGCSGNEWWEGHGGDDIEGWTLCESRSGRDSCTAWDYP